MAGTCNLHMWNATTLVNVCEQPFYVKDSAGAWVMVNPNDPAKEIHAYNGIEFKRVVCEGVADDIEIEAINMFTICGQSTPSGAIRLVNTTDLVITGNSTPPVVTGYIVAADGGTPVFMLASDPDFNGLHTFVPGLVEGTLLNDNGGTVTVVIEFANSLGVNVQYNLTLTIPPGLWEAGEGSCPGGTVPFSDLPYTITAA